MKQILKGLVVCVMLLATVVMTTVAANKSRIGTAGAQELLIPVGARGIAIGGSSMVLTHGVESIFWNPAGLGKMTTSVEAMVSDMQYIDDINVVYGALGVKAGEFGTLGFSIKSIGFGSIPVTTTDAPDGTGENYSPNYITLGFTYGKAVTDRIAVGVTASLISERIMSMSASGVAFNFGIQYQNLAVQGLSLGLAVKNVGSGMKFTGSDLTTTAAATTGGRGTSFYSIEASSSELPSNLEIGVGYTRKLDEKNVIQIGGMFRNNNYQDDEYNLGAEYGFNDLFFVRGGYTFAPQADKDPTGAKSFIYDFTLGAGIHYMVGDLDLSFDYAYRHVKYFDSNNIVTLRLGF